MPVTRSQHNRSQGLSLDRDTTNDSGTVDLGVGVDTSVAPSIPQAQGSRRSSRIQSGDTRIFKDKSTKEKGKEKEKEKGKGRGQSQRNQSSGKIGSRRMGQQESSESGVMREDGSKVDSREKEKNNSEDFVFFWKTNEKYGWASQWYYSPFSARIRFEVQSASFPLLI